MVYHENTFFLSSKTLSGLSVMYITFWFNAFSIMSDFFFFCTTFIESIWGFEKEIFSHCISPGVLKEGNFSFFFLDPVPEPCPGTCMFSFRRTQRFEKWKLSSSIAQLLGLVQVLFGRWNASPFRFSQVDQALFAFRSSQRGFHFKFIKVISQLPTIV